MTIPLSRANSEFRDFLAWNQQQAKPLEWQSPRPVTIDLEAEWAKVRRERNYKLTACDWTQVVDAPLTSTEILAWREYRQALRDITNHVDPFSIIWPTEPGKGS